MRELYEGTRLGRQELQGAMILDPQNALFKDEWLIHGEIAEGSIEQVTVGVDPPGGADEVGIVASALLNDGRFAVLADRTTAGSPAQWGEAAVKCHDDFDADDIVVEVNFGGDMATEVVKQAAERIHTRGERDTNMIRTKEVSASRGKAMWAEPISLLYEKSRVLHRRGLDQLEAEMMAFSREWDRATDGSPNRLDAMVWGLTRLSKIITNIPIAQAVRAFVGNLRVFNVRNDVSRVASASSMRSDAALTNLRRLASSPNSINYLVTERRSAADGIGTLVRTFRLENISGLSSSFRPRAGDCFDSTPPGGCFLGREESRAGLGAEVSGIGPTRIASPCPPMLAETPPMGTESKPKAPRKAKRRRKPPEEFVDYIVAIEDCDWGYSLSLIPTATRSIPITSSDT